MAWSHVKGRLERLAIGEALWSLAEKVWQNLPVAFLSAMGVRVMAAWEWAASQGWGLMVVLGVALGYATLGLLMMGRWLVWPRPVGPMFVGRLGSATAEIETHSPGEASASLLPEAEITRLRAEVTAMTDNLSTRIDVISERLTKIEGMAEHGEGAYDVIHAATMRRFLKVEKWRLEKIVKSINALPDVPSKAIDSSAHLIRDIDNNINELVRGLVEAGIKEASALRSELRLMDEEMGHMRSFPEVAGPDPLSQWGKDRGMLRDKVGRLHVLIEKRRTEYTARCNVPMTTWRPDA